jgi:hypothetical protein
VRIAAVIATQATAGAVRTQASFHDQVFFGIGLHVDVDALG